MAGGCYVDDGAEQPAPAAECTSACTQNGCQDAGFDYYHPPFGYTTGCWLWHGGTVPELGDEPVPIEGTCECLPPEPSPGPSSGPGCGCRSLPAEYATLPVESYRVVYVPEGQNASLASGCYVGGQDPYAEVDPADIEFATECTTESGACTDDECHDLGADFFHPAFDCAPSGLERPPIPCRPPAEPSLVARRRGGLLRVARRLRRDD